MGLILYMYARFIMKNLPTTMKVGRSDFNCSLTNEMNFCLLNHSCCLNPPVRYMLQ